MRVTKEMLELKLNIANAVLEEHKHPLRLWHDGGAYGNGPRLYWHKPGDKYLQEKWATGRMRIGLCWDWVDAFSQGAYTIHRAVKEQGA